MEFFKLLVIAATLEALWETCKMFWQEGKANIDRIGAALFGVFLCIAAGGNHQGAGCDDVTPVS